MSTIALGDLFRQAIDVVETQRITYLVYGGLTVPVWGQVVPTKDVDLVIRVREPEAARLMTALRAAGFSVPPKAEALFFIDTWFVASKGGRDVDFALGATPFDDTAFKRSVRETIFGRTVPIVTAEDLILYKLVSHRRKDLGHVEDIMIRQGAELDRAYLREWANRIAEATGKFEVPATLDQMLKEQGL